MVEVYYYIPANKAEHAVECGLKLSEWFDKEVIIHGAKRKSMTGFLNPKDDIEKYRSDSYKCIKLEVPPKYCFVADKYLYDTGLKASEVMDLYTKSIILVEKYTFGSYRIPECLVISTVIGGHITVLNKRLDSPVLFDNSEELYINNLIEHYKEKSDSFNDVLLYNFYCKLADFKKVDKIEDEENKIAVFFDRRNNKVVTIKIPDMDEW